MTSKENLQQNRPLYLSSALSPMLDTFYNVRAPREHSVPGLYDSHAAKPEARSARIGRGHRHSCVCGADFFCPWGLSP
jgi:hypothetical protein